jgi:hypothetical protein
MAARSSAPEKAAPCYGFDTSGCSLQPERLDDRGRLGVAAATPGTFLCTALGQSELLVARTAIRPLNPGHVRHIH